MYFINYGIESMDQNVLNNMKKGLRPDMIEQGIKDTLKVGISPGLTRYLEIKVTIKKQLKKLWTFSKNTMISRRKEQLDQLRLILITVILRCYRNGINR